VHVSSVLPDDMDRLKLTDENGALVRVVVPGGPADRAGLQVDDVIEAFEGEALPGPERLRWVATLAGVGKPVTLRVSRGGRVFDLKVTLDELPDEPPAAHDDDAPESGRWEFTLGWNPKRCLPFPNVAPSRCRESARSLGRKQARD